ncbi:hypothetical protein ACEPAF_5551 [Sanghuangporus sanghuang]
MAKRHHPDHAGPAGDAAFMEIREAYEILIKLLKDPAKVFAYERFGPFALDWFGCSTQMDYLERGTSQLILFYFAFGIILTCIWLVIRRSPVIFWHYITLLSALLGMLIPGPLVFEHALFIRYFLIYLSTALLGVVPALIPEEAKMSPEEVERLVVQEFRIVNLKLDNMNDWRGSFNSATSSASSSSDRVRNLSEAETEGSIYSVPRYNPRPKTPEMRTDEEEGILVEAYLFS